MATQVPKAETSGRMMARPTVADQKRWLDSFLVENPELEELSSRLSEFNLFDVLRVDNAEIRHSNVLAWLLNPHGSHQLGATFIRRFLSNLLHVNNDTFPGLTPVEVELMDFGDVEVLREWQNIDILVRSRSNRWCLLVENKIHSAESSGQLSRYRSRVQQEMTDSTVIPVFLTLDGDEASAEGQESGFLSHSHLQILELLESVLIQRRQQLTAPVQLFLDQYVGTLRRLTMNDPEIVELCRRIYRRHEQAIDLIVELGATSFVLDAVQQTIEKSTDCFMIRQYAKSVWFLPVSIADIVPKDAPLTAWNHLPVSAPVAFRLEYLKSNGTLRLIFELGPLEDGELRRRLLSAFQDSGFEVREKSFKEGAKFTRILSMTGKLPQSDGALDTSSDEVEKAVSSLWKKFNEPLQRIENVLMQFEWPD